MDTLRVGCCGNKITGSWYDFRLRPSTILLLTSGFQWVAEKDESGKMVVRGPGKWDADTPFQDDEDV